MKLAIGKGYTREDHPEVFSQLYANYAIAKDIQAMKAVIGEEALSEEDHLYLDFIQRYDDKFLNQGSAEGRDIFQSLDLSWSILKTFPRDMLTRISAETLDEYYNR